jgi:hypothetical protein
MDIGIIQFLKIIRPYIHGVTTMKSLCIVCSIFHLVGGLTHSGPSTFTNKVFTWELTICSFFQIDLWRFVLQIWEDNSLIILPHRFLKRYVGFNCDHHYILSNFYYFFQGQFPRGFSVLYLSRFLSILILFRCQKGVMQNYPMPTMKLQTAELNNND